MPIKKIIHMIAVLPWRESPNTMLSLSVAIQTADEERGRAVAAQTGRSKVAPFFEPNFVTADMLDEHFKQGPSD